MMALYVANRPEYEKVIKKARNFLVGLQEEQSRKLPGDSPFNGGIGYGGTYDHSDLIGHFVCFGGPLLHPVPRKRSGRRF